MRFYKRIILNHCAVFQLRDVAFADPAVEDQAAGWIELIAGGAAADGDGGEEDASGEKNDKRGGEALVVMEL